MMNVTKNYDGAPASPEAGDAVVFAARIAVDFPWVFDPTGKMRIRAIKAMNEITQSLGIAKFSPPTSLKIIRSAMISGAIYANSLYQDPTDRTRANFDNSGYWFNYTQLEKLKNFVQSLGYGSRRSPGRPRKTVSINQRKVA